MVGELGTPISPLTKQTSCILANTEIAYLTLPNSLAHPINIIVPIIKITPINKFYKKIFFFYILPSIYAQTPQSVFVGMKKLYFYLKKSKKCNPISEGQSH